jgi:putative lipoic acid-binding regulatory protein
VRPSLAHLLIISASQDFKFEFLVKSRVDQVKTAMTYSMKSENKLDGASNFRAWKTRIDLILAKNKVLDIVKGKIVKPEFEEGKEKESQNIVVMEKFKDDDINVMSIIVESIKDHLIPYISHLDSSKRMYDALTNLFSVRNVGQIMSLKNELRDMKTNDDDSITSYFVRISQLRDQLQAIEEIISEKELVNIVLNGLPKMWDAFPASMNTRKEYPTFEELWTCCAQEESRISAKEKPQKKYDDQAFTARFKNFMNKRNFGSRRKPNQEKYISEIQCFNCRKYGHYKNHCPELKKRKEKHEASVAEEKKPAKKTKQDERDFFF